MKQFINLLLLFTICLPSIQATDPCPCSLPANDIVEAGHTYKGLLLYADWHSQTLKSFLDDCNQILSYKTLKPGDRQTITKAKNTASSAYGKLKNLKTKISRVGEMTKKQYSNYLLEVNGIAQKGMLEFFRKKPKPGGSGDCDDSYQRPDCSSQSGNIIQSCSRGVNIMAGCGFYSENGGASAMQHDLEMCGITGANMLQMCLTAVSLCQPFQASIAGRDYESDAYSVCSQFDDDKMNMDPAETQTNTGN